MSLIDGPDDQMQHRARQVFASETFGSAFKESFCGAHTGMYLFDAFGDIYSCWEKTGDPGIRMGRVTPDSRVEFSAPVELLWRSRTVASNPVCRQCRYALHCGGGCAVLAFGRNGQYHTNFCDGFSSRFRNAVSEAFRAHIAGAPADQGHERVCDM